MDATQLYAIAIILTIILFSGVFWRTIIRLFKESRSTFVKSASSEEKKQMIKEIEKAIIDIRTHKKGATIIIDQQSETSPFIVDSTVLDANVNAGLITSIFMTNTPLHDGAIIIRGTKLTDAAAFITSLSESKRAPKSFGTRHRSALGIAEQSNALVIVLSEETKKVTIFKRGAFQAVPLKGLFQTISNHWTK